MTLNKAKAERAIKEKIADPLSVNVVEAAALIRNIVDQNMASAIKREVHMRGYKPEDFVIFAFGGAGPTHAAGSQGRRPQGRGVSIRAGILRIRLVDYGHRPYV